MDGGETAPGTPQNNNKKKQKHSVVSLSVIGSVTLKSQFDCLCTSARIALFPVSKEHKSILVSWPG